MLERDRAGKVDDRARDRCDRDTADKGDLVCVEGRWMQVQEPAATPAAAPRARHVHTIKRHVPDRQTVQHRGRHVADHCAGADLLDRSTHLECIPRHRITEPRIL